MTDSLSPTAEGWAAILRSSALTHTFTQTYASFDPATAQISTPHYTMGFAATHFGFDYLALNGSAALRELRGVFTEVGAVVRGMESVDPARECLYA